MGVMRRRYRAIEPVLRDALLLAAVDRCERTDRVLFEVKAGGARWQRNPRGSTIWRESGLDPMVRDEIERVNSFHFLAVH
jgi:hypothetical protein